MHYCIAESGQPFRCNFKRFKEEIEGKNFWNTTKIFSSFLLILLVIHVLHHAKELKGNSANHIKKAHIINIRVTG